MRILSLILTLTCATAAIFAEGRIAWNETEHDFGTIKEADGRVSHDFMLVNAGDSDVAIIRVRTSCGCAVAEYPRRPVHPGDTAIITATFNPMGRAGDFTTFVTVFTNVEPRRTELSLQGRVIAGEMTVNEAYPYAVGSLKLNAGSIPMGEICDKNKTTATIEAYNDSDTPMRYHVDRLPRYVSVSPEKATIGPHERKIIKVEFDAKRCKRHGYVEGQFALLAEPVDYDADALAGIRRIDVMATVSDDFASWSKRQLKDAPEMAFDCDRILFTDIDTVAVTRHMVIANHGNDPLKIYGIRSTDECIAIGDYGSSIASGETMTVDVTVDPAKTDDVILNTSIIIYSNDPRRHIEAMRIVGNKKQ